jgi:hypothetical protein
VSERWAVCLPRESVASLGRLRLVPRLSVCVEGEEVWLQGETTEETLEKALRGLPGARRFSIFPDRQLLAAGTRVPNGYLSEGPWQPLAKWLGVTLDAAALAGKIGESVAVRLVRSTSSREANVLVTTLATWKGYGGSAPQVRLERWSFAVSDSGDVVVRGTPLPPLPGQPYVEREGIAVPAGWEWRPPVDAVVLRDVLGLTASDLALLHPDEAWDRVPAGAFVLAARSAIRLSGEEKPHVG